MSVYNNGHSGQTLSHFAVLTFPGVWVSGAISTAKKRAKKGVCAGGWVRAAARETSGPKPSCARAVARLNGVGFVGWVR